MLKAYKGERKDTEPVHIPPLMFDAHPVDVPSGISAYRQV